MRYLKLTLITIFAFFFLNGCSGETTDNNQKQGKKPETRDEQLPPVDLNSPKFQKIKAYLDTFRGKRFLTLGSQDVCPLQDDPDSVPILVHFLKDNDWAVKARAAHALGKTKDPRAFEPLLKLFRNRRGKNNACTSGATALGELGDQRAAYYLIKALKHPIPEIRRSAASGLIKLKSPKALPHLLERLNDPDKTMRNNVAFAIAEYEDPSTFDVLKKALEKETDNNIKYAYVKGIEKCGHPESVPYLCGLLLDPSEGVKRSTAFALSSLKDSRAIPAFKKAVDKVSDPEIKQMYSHFLKRLEEDARTGSLASIDGKATPRVRAASDTMVGLDFPPGTPQSAQVSVTPSLHLSVYPGHITQYVEPLYVHNVEGYYLTGTHLFLAYRSHLEVHDRKTMAGRIYNYTDGYRGFKHRRARCTDFRDYIAFSDDPGDHTTSAKVRDFYTVYDKEKQRLFELSAEEFQEHSKKWKKAPVYEEQKTGLMVRDKKPNETYIDKCFYYIHPKSGRKSFFFDEKRHQVNAVSDIAVRENRLYATTPKGIRMFEGERETGLYPDDGKSLFSTGGTTRVNDGKYHYYMESGFRFKVETYSEKEHKEVFSAYFWEAVNGLSIHQGRVFIVTAVGFSVFDPAAMTLVNYFDNPVEVKDKNARHYGDYYVGGRTYCIGRRGRHLLFYINNNFKKIRRLAAYNLDTHRVEDSTEGIIPPKVAEYLLIDNFAQLEVDFLVDRKARKIFRFAPGLPLVRDYSYPAVPADQLLPNIFHMDIPYPVGKERKVRVAGDVLWVLTEKGLFSSPLAGKTWTPHYRAVPALFGNKIIVTPRYIFGFRWGNDHGVQPEHARIDRETHRLETFGNHEFYACANSLRTDGSRILYAFRSNWKLKTGIVQFRLDTRMFSIFPTPGDVYQVALWGRENIITVGLDRVYMMTGNGKIKGTVRLNKKLDVPILAEVRRDVLWLTTEGYLIEANLKTRKVRDWPVMENYEPVGLAFGEEEMFIFTDSGIHRKEAGDSPVRILKGWLKNRHGKYLSFHSAYDFDSRYVLLAADDGIYRFDKGSWELTRSCINFERPVSISTDEQSVFIGTYSYGIFEVSRPFMEKSFTCTHVVFP